MGYAKEFNFENYIVPACIQTIEWQDVSWHHDVCPRFENETSMLAVWVDCTDQTKREYEDWKQYTVVQLIRINKEETTLADAILFATESASALCKWLVCYDSVKCVERCIAIANNAQEPDEGVQDALVTCLTELQESLKKLETA